MRAEQRLFLAQARSCFDVFRHLAGQADIPRCHPLHYLQMATELLAKASLWRSGLQPDLTHSAFVAFLRNLVGNTSARKKLGWEGKHEGWKREINGYLPLAQQVEDLAPAVAEKKRSLINPEYPWPAEAPTHCPAEYRFPLWDELTRRGQGRQFIDFLGRLFAAADAFL